MKNPIVISIILLLVSYTPKLYINSNYTQAPPTNELKKILIVVNTDKAPKDYYRYFGMELRRNLKPYKIESKYYRYDENTTSSEEEIETRIQTYQPDAIIYVELERNIMGTRYNPSTHAGTYEEAIVEVITKISVQLPDDEDAFWEAFLKTKSNEDSVTSTEALVEKLVRDKVIKNQEVD